MSSASPQAPSSPASTPPPPSQERQLTQEELELRNMMRTPEPEGEPNLRQDTSASGSQVTEGGGPTGGDVSANTRPSDSVVGFARPGAHSNELIYARRLASKHKLQPYQREAVDEFTKDTIIGQQIRLFIQQCELGNKLDTILVVAPPFLVSKPLSDNIKSYGLAVLLSPKLSAYKCAGVPVSHVIAIIRRHNLHLPTNIDHDPNALLTLRTTVGETLTQLRSTIKKMIKVSITSKQGIYDLGIKVVGDSPCTVTVKLCARLALMRSLYTDDSSFWGLVDQKLTLIRSMASGDEDKISRALSAYLECDRTKYSARSEAYTIPELGDMWQQDVDDIVGNHGLPSQVEAPLTSAATST